MRKIAVLGSRSWRSILAPMLADNDVNNQAVLYGNQQSTCDGTNEKHSNSHYMRGWSLDKSVLVTTDLTQAVKDNELILLVVPTKAIREVAQNAKKAMLDTSTQPLTATVTKGIEPGNKELISQTLTEETYPDHEDKVVAISGPSHAENVTQEDITAITCASTDFENAEKVQEIFSNDYICFYISNDLIGAEIGGAVENVIAIAAGMLAGKKYGDNAKAALVTRGSAEIMRLSVSFGAQPRTFNGLSGIGDLIVTCTSVNSRDWRAGKALGKGQKLEAVSENMGQVVEGAVTAKAVHEICQRDGIDMPIPEAIYKVLYEDADTDEEIRAMMCREKTNEVRW